MSLSRMRVLVSEVETIFKEHTDQPQTAPVVAAKGFFGMKEELVLLLETIAKQLAQRDEQLRLYGRTRLSITLGLKAHRGLEMAAEKLAAMEQQVEKDHHKWISPLSDEDYAVRMKMCETLRTLLPSMSAAVSRVHKIANK